MWPTLTMLDAFSGEGGAARGYRRAAVTLGIHLRIVGVDTSAARLARYPFETHRGDAIEYTLEHGHKFDLIHASPTCTGYSRGTAAIPDRLTKYDRLIAATREALVMTGRPYVIENVFDARSELVSPLMLCGSEFGLTATDDDGTPLRLERHRMFESSLFLYGAGGCRHDPGVQVAGSYGGARRDKWEAKHVRKGGYVPSADVQRALLGTPWMTEKGCQLSIPPAFTEFLGAQLLAQLEAAA